MVMKLLPKLRGKVPRRPILGSVQEQKNKFHYNETHSIRENGTKLVYNDYSKKLIRDNPGIIKAIKFLEQNRNEKRFIDLKGKFEILNVTHFMHTVDDYKRGGFQNDTYLIKIKSDKKDHLLFLKKESISSTDELILLNTIEKYTSKFGLNIIKPHLAFEHYVHKFIAYDFTDKLTVADARRLNKIDLKESRIIQDRLFEFENTLRKKYNIPIGNLTINNCFIDIYKTPYALYLFDPFIYDELPESLIKLKNLRKDLINQK